MSLKRIAAAALLALTACGLFLRADEPPESREHLLVPVA